MAPVITTIKFLAANLDPDTAQLAAGGDAVCAFVNSDCGAETLSVLAKAGIKLLLMRCAGYNNVDLAAAKANGITVMRVPGYSPEAVAEHAMALAQAANRRICKAYIKVRNNNFALDGLLGQNFYGACAGIVGTGRIGAAMARICHGFGMNVLCYDMYKNPEVEKFARYVSLEELLQKADLVSLHCPLTEGTHHMINRISPTMCWKTRWCRCYSASPMWLLPATRRSLPARHCRALRPSRWKMPVPLPAVKN